MITVIISLIVLLITLIGAGLLARSFQRRPIISDDPLWIDRKELGHIEETIANLVEVILIADEIEVPTRERAGEILIALIDNFIDGVQYNFLVYSEYYHKEAERITGCYNNIVRVAQDLGKKPLSNSNLFQLHEYPFKRPDEDYPYLFYRYALDSGGDEIIAFRGEEKGCGIAETYRRLEPEVGRTILLRALPFIHREELATEKYENFSPTTKLITFEKSPKKIGEMLQ